MSTQARQDHKEHESAMHNNKRKDNAHPIEPLTMYRSSKAMWNASQGTTSINQPIASLDPSGPKPKNSKGFDGCSFHEYRYQPSCFVGSTPKEVRSTGPAAPRGGPKTVLQKSWCHLGAPEARSPDPCLAQATFGEAGSAPKKWCLLDRGR
jgi:hypothetical protein